MEPTEAEVEQWARVAYEAEVSEYEKVPWDEVPEHWKPEYRAYARAVAQAAREPLEQGNARLTGIIERMELVWMNWLEGGDNSTAMDALIAMSDPLGNGDWRHAQPAPAGEDGAW